MKYLIIIEHGEKNYSAYVPDLPGCIAAGKTRVETMDLIKEAMIEHIQLIKQSGEKIPLPHTESALLEIAI